MKPIITFFGFVVALVMLSAITLGLLISVGNGRTNWVLMGVFLIDSLLLIVLAAGILIKLVHNPPGPRP